MTHRQAIVFAAGAIGAALVVAAAVGRARQPSDSPTPQVALLAHAEAAAPAKLPSILIRAMPHVRQKPDFCGEACAAMMLQKLGVAADQDYVFDCSGLDPAEGRGCFTKELAAALKKIGFDVGPVWHKIAADRSAEEIDGQWRSLHADLADGVATIACTHFDERPGASEHFRLVLGYDADKDEVVYHEPAEDAGAYRRMARATFLRLWPLKYTSETWTVIRIPLRPGWLDERGRNARGARPPVVPAAAGNGPSFTPADYAQHVMELKKKVPDRGFTIVVQPPFVVVGDNSPWQVRQSAEGTVKWAVDHLKRSYFTKDPNEILDIWLFKDKASYEKHASTIFRTKPSTPFGYYSAADRALVMNIATGGGTLVHEIVHPFIRSNFPKCPSWLNEGLGSLYEQSAERNGRIVGLTNWRLAGLQEAIRQKRVPSFKTLCSTTERGFYDDDPGTNYAQARYLCYYLQEKGLLEDFYRRLHQRHADDPTGYETLQNVLGRPDMAAFQKDWEAFVMGLRFP